MDKETVVHIYNGIFNSAQLSRSVMSNSVRPHESQHTRPPCPSSTPGVYPNLMSIESVMPSSHLILCCPLLLLPPIPPSIRVFSIESTLRMRWPKYWRFSFSMSPSNGILLSHKKEHIWVSANEVDELRVYYIEWSKSEREKQILHFNSYIWKLERWYLWTYFQGISGDTDVENRFMDMGRWGRERVGQWRE